MTAQGVAVWILLGCGVAVDLVCALGLLALGSVYDRVHLLGPPAIFGTALIAAAVVVREGHSPLGIKAILITLVMWVAGPVLTHATIRVARVRSGGWLPDEPASPEDR